ncbi:PREDICTED: NAC domain-containing protein 78-like [Camelina sativa]|uniref:NAC domain-containing protein 78-like n=1 Tax=Camelina sativa TaxID=90675 RepID=A0ABM0Y3Z3_CAMSA|nr:PREDICTED: NAC domain-containing protein 78-like [Camelina sativa]
MDRDSKKPYGALPAPREVQVNAAAVTSLAPGFRFHPTDEELITYYLKRKVQGKSMRLDAIGEVDFYKHEPWNLPEHSKLKTRDKEWYFFSILDKKYSTGTCVKRVTKQGYWHVTGKDKEIHRGDGEVSIAIGMMKIHVFHKGRSPYGRRTNWVMHEYRLAENDEGLQVDAYVLCKVFRKQNPGEPIESRYAPFVEQEWDDDGERAVSPVPVVVDANRINETQQIDDNNKELDDKALKRSPILPHCDIDKEAPLSLCVLNKQAPLPLVQYKRKRRVDSSENPNSSSQMTQDHCSSSTATIVDTSAAEPEPLTNSEQDAISVLKSGFGSMIEDLGNKQEEAVAEKVPATTSSLTKSIQDLMKEKDEMVVLRETQIRETIEAEILINYLEDQIKTLRKGGE